MINGLGISNGISIGTAYVLMKTPVENSCSYSSPESESVAFETARTAAINETTRLKGRTLSGFDPTTAEIFEAQCMMLEDLELIDPIHLLIQSGETAFDAIQQHLNRVILMFESMEDDYIRERASDVRDIKERLINALVGKNHSPIENLPPDTIIVAYELTPSDTARMDIQNTIGLLTETGGHTSHVAIMARTLEIAAISGIPDIVHRIQTGDIVVMDGFTGELEVCPSQQELEAFKLRKEKRASEQKELSIFQGKATVTGDGHEFKLYANIGTHVEIARVIANDAEGVGLFRSEFLFMDCNRLPSEDEQFSAYKAVVEGMRGKPVIVRTLDIGGDKELPLLGLDKEENPFLGQRAIRLCLNRPELFQTQLKALLRASVFGNLRIMFPMISSLDELRAAKQQIDIAKASLSKRGSCFSEDVEVGIMIEIPAAAIIADSFARECDFFSIGTNDLIQYTVAVDRGNPSVSSIYTAYHPAVLRLISMTAEAARRHEIPCGMCGEAAADPLLTPVLLGFGLHELSMNPSSILPMRKHIGNVNMADAIDLSKKILGLKTAKEVQEALEVFADSL